MFTARLQAVFPFVVTSYPMRILLPFYISTVFKKSIQVIGIL